MLLNVIKNKFKTYPLMHYSSINGKILKQRNQMNHSLFFLGERTLGRVDIPNFGDE